MKSITINLPHDFDIDEKEIKMDLACHWYTRGKLTLGQAAEMVGYSKETFMELLGKSGFEFYNYNPEDLDKDVANAGKHSFYEG